MISNGMSTPPFISWRSELPSIIILGLIAIASAYLSNALPETVITHWNSSGEGDGSSPRFFVVSFFPLLALGIYLLLLSVWQLDPKRGRYHEFKHAYHGVKTMLVAFVATVYGLVAANGLGFTVNMSCTLLVLVGLLFVGIGIYLPSIKQNWMFGVRTPWTLESETVWNKTHELAGKTFIVGGIILVVGAFLPSPAVFPVFFLAIIFAAIVPVFYSYILFRRQRK